jgi:hypothetical protein
LPSSFTDGSTPKIPRIENGEVGQRDTLARSSPARVSPDWRVLRAATDAPVSEERETENA